MKLSDHKLKVLLVSAILLLFGGIIVAVQANITNDVIFNDAYLSLNRAQKMVLDRV